MPDDKPLVVIKAGEPFSIRIEDGKGNAVEFHDFVVYMRDVVIKHERPPRPPQLSDISLFSTIFQGPLKEVSITARPIKAPAKALTGL